ncbi:hypothetical protein ACIBSR_06765 [Streptomyces sp. NPDC049936]
MTLGDQLIDSVTHPRDQVHVDLTKQGKHRPRPGIRNPLHT